MRDRNHTTWYNLYGNDDLCHFSANGKGLVSTITVFISTNYLRICMAHIEINMWDVDRLGFLEITSHVRI